MFSRTTHRKQWNSRDPRDPVDVLPRLVCWVAIPIRTKSRRPIISSINSGAAQTGYRRCLTPMLAQPGLTVRLKTLIGTSAAGSLTST